MNKNKVVTAEIWRDVAGYNGAYQVSSLGRVRSTDRVINLTNGRQRHVSGHIIRPHDNGLGYMQANLMNESHKLLGLSQCTISAHVNSGKPLATGLRVVRDNDTDTKQADKAEEVA